MHARVLCQYYPYYSLSIKTLGAKIKTLGALQKSKKLEKYVLKKTGLKLIKGPKIVCVKN